jgi:hypothetical protein
MDAGLRDTIWQTLRGLAPGDQQFVLRATVEVVSEEETTC